MTLTAPPSLGPPSGRVDDVHSTVERPVTASGWSATLILSAACVVLQWFRVRDTWFAVDDFILLGEAHEEPIGLEYLRRPVFEHFSPILRLANDVVVGPLSANHAAALAIGLLITAGGVIGMHRLTLRLSRSAPWALTLSALYGTSLLLTTSLRWWTASVHGHLAAALSIACMLWFCRYTASRRLLDGVVSIAFLGAALLTHEKALLLVGCIGLLWLTAFQDRYRPAELWSALREDIWLWASYLVLTAAAMANFLASYYQAHERAPLLELVTFARRSVFSTFLPATFGVRFPDVGGSLGLTVPVVAAIGLTLAVYASVRVSRRAWRGWTFLLVTFAVNLWVLGSARLSVFGDGIYRSLLWQQELAFLFPIGLAIVVRWTRSTAAPARTRRSRRGLSIVMLSALVAYTAFSARSAAVLEAEFDMGSHAQTFLANLRSDVSRLPDDAVLLDRPLPPDFAPSWMFPYNLLGFALETFGVSAVVGGHDDDQPVYVVADDGHVHQYVIDPLAPGGSGEPIVVLGPAVDGAGTCVEVSEEGAAFRIPLHEDDVLDAPRVLRLHYRIDRPLSVNVVGATASTSVELSTGRVDLEPTRDAQDFTLVPLPQAVHLDLLFAQGSQPGVACLADATLGVAQTPGG